MMTFVVCFTYFLFFFSFPPVEKISEESGEVFGAVAASFLAAKGCTAKMDLLHTEAGDKKYLAFLNVGWGMVRRVPLSVPFFVVYDRWHADPCTLPD